MEFGNKCDIACLRPGKAARFAACHRHIAERIPQNTSQTLRRRPKASSYRGMQQRVCSTMGTTNIVINIILNSVSSTGSIPERMIASTRECIQLASLVCVCVLLRTRHEGRVLSLTWPSRDPSRLHVCHNPCLYQASVRGIGMGLFTTIASIAMTIVVATSPYA